VLNTFVSIYFSILHRFSILDMSFNSFIECKYENKNNVPVAYMYTHTHIYYILTTTDYMEIFLHNL